MGHLKKSQIQVKQVVMFKLKMLSDPQSTEKIQDVKVKDQIIKKQAGCL